MPISSADEAWLARYGIPTTEARRQVRLLQSGTPSLRLSRAARIGDGIVRLTLLERDHWVHQARGSASLGFFVPASGAASRMFAKLRELAVAPAALASNPQVRALLNCAVVRHSLDAAGLASSVVAEEVQALLAAPPKGLGWLDLPKAFLPFHVDNRNGVHTAFEDQIHEICDTLGTHRRGSLHITLNAEQLQERLQLQAIVKRIACEHECFLELEISAQDPATDTLALCSDGDLARDVLGHPKLRAGGHGSLLENLSATPGDAVLIKNIDNIQPRWRQGGVVPWRLALAGIALELRRQGDRLLSSHPRSLAESETTKTFSSLLTHLGRPTPGNIELLRDLAARPLRVAGMVRNDGAPGGGPFWVEGKGLQIVEQSEVSQDAEQRVILENATHFNPVEMACCMRRPDGSPHDLEAFRDPTRAFVSEKPDGNGESLRVLEHPGLWNGSMGGWLTVFVEIPPETFLPAKTIFDLSHPWRQPPEGN
jgi:hypothetical protein